MFSIVSPPRQPPVNALYNRGDYDTHSDNSDHRFPAVKLDLNGVLEE
jgi:hypothetical protein